MEISEKGRMGRAHSVSNLRLEALACPFHYTVRSEQNGTEETGF